MYYVYLLTNEKGTTYVGYTNDLRRRYHEHQTGKNIYTRKGEWNLVYYEAYLNKADAMLREKRLKDGRARTQLKNRIQSSIDESLD